MHYWSCEHINDEKNQYIKDLFFFRSLGKQEFEKGDKIYDEGVKLGLFTNRMKSVHTIFTKSKKTGNITASLKSKSGKWILQVLLKEHEYKLIVKGGN